MAPSPPLDSLAAVAPVVKAALQFVLVVVVTGAVSLVLVEPIVQRVGRRVGIDERLQTFFGNVLSVVTALVGLGLGFYAAGLELVVAVLFATLAILAVGVGFAADGLVGDVVGGVLLLLARPFQRGDWIAFADVEGRVERIDLRTTKIRTFDNEEVTVPNSLINDVPVTNRTAQDLLRQTYEFGVDYDENLEKAMACIVAAAEETEGIISDPAPTVRVERIDPSWVTLKTRIWLSNPSRADYIDVRSAFVQNAKDRLHKQNITLNPSVTKITGEIATVEADGDSTDIERPEPDG